jgi:DNA-binding transcriptional ArsR family regulator
MTMTPLDRLVQVHKALGHPVRLRLLAALRTGPLCVCQMTVVVKLAASTVSEHLSELRRAGLLSLRKEGRWVEYRLSERADEDGLFAALWPALEHDRDAEADALLVRELRKIPLDELCSVDLDITRLGRPRLSAAFAKSEAIRAARS